MTLPPPTTLVAHVYNPDNQSKEDLINAFVVRVKMFQRLYAEIKDAPMQMPEQDILIQGKRGMGKTTLLLRLAYEMENDNDLNSWLLPVVFNEEEYGIRRLYKLWERIAILLEDKYEIFTGLFEEMDASFANDEAAYEEHIFELLLKKLREHEKKIVLFIDNFGDIFNRFKVQEVQRLRTVLQTTPDLRIIAASSRVIDDFYKNDHPFYEFFKSYHLGGLSQKETETILLKLGEIYGRNEIKDILKNQRGRVEALRRLTGGVIRTVVLLFEIFNDANSTSAFSDLEMILDRVTPLYKHRMDDLPAQQQEIMEAIAIAWDAVTTKEIAQKTRLPSKQVSAQLRALEKNEIIEKRLTTTKNHLYLIQERFFNIWYLMRHGRKGDRNKVLWLVRFLEEWCDEKQLTNRAEQHINLLKSGNFEDRFAWYMTEAIAGARHINLNLQHEIIETTKDALRQKNSEYLNYIDQSDIVLINRIYSLIAKKNFQQALEVINKLRLRNDFILGYISEKQEDFQQAEHHYQESINLRNDTAAKMKLANLYAYQLENKELATKYYQQLFTQLQTKELFELFLFDLEDGGYGLFFLKFLSNHPSLNIYREMDEYSKQNLENVLLSQSLVLMVFFEKRVDSKLIEGKLYQLIQILLNLQIIFKSYQNVYNLYEVFSEGFDVKYFFKPHYYALMYFLKDEYPNEYLRMGDELKETVEELIAEILDLREKYGIKA